VFGYTALVRYALIASPRSFSFVVAIRQSSNTAEPSAMIPGRINNANRDKLAQNRQPAHGLLKTVL
jgi:hypothetical protein